MIEAIDDLHTIEVTTSVLGKLQERTFERASLSDKGPFLKVRHGSQECWFSRNSVVRVRIGPAGEQ